MNASKQKNTDLFYEKFQPSEFQKNRCRYSSAFLEQLMIGACLIKSNQFEKTGPIIINFSISLENVKIPLSKLEVDHIFRELHTFALLTYGSELNIKNKSKVKPQKKSKFEP